MDIEPPPADPVDPQLPPVNAVPPFSPEQLQWIDHLIASRQGQVANGPLATDTDPSVPPSTVSPPLTTSASQSGKRRTLWSFSSYTDNLLMLFFNLGFALLVI